MEMKLIHKSSGKEVKPGDLVTDFRGDKTFVSDPVGREPQHDGSTGRIYVEPSGEFYPSVFNCKWVKE